MCFLLGYAAGFLPAHQPMVTIAYSWLHHRQWWKGEVQCQHNWWRDFHCGFLKTWWTGASGCVPVKIRVLKRSNKDCFKGRQHRDRTHLITPLLAFLSRHTFFHSLFPQSFGIRSLHCPGNTSHTRIMVWGRRMSNSRKLKLNDGEEGSCWMRVQSGEHYPPVITAPVTCASCA